MLYTLKNNYISYSLNEQGQVVSILNVRNGHEYCKVPSEIFRMIYQVEDFDERTIDATWQEDPQITVEGNVMTVYYPRLKSDDRIVEVELKFTLTLEDNTLQVVADIQNNCEVQVMELQTMAFAGIMALDEDPKQDTLLVPLRLGRKIPNPSQTDFFKHSQLIKRKYDRPDAVYSSLDVPYPGHSSMQWYTLYNENESVYVGNHDTEHRILCQHIERRMSDNTLRMGMNQYPFLAQGEHYQTPPVVYAILEGDWHSGSKFYRKWMVEDYGWKAPQRPDWVKDFQGWLRVIFRTQSGEYNFRFTDIPRLFDQVQAAGLNTLFVLGWPQGGFGKLRPDYWLDPRYEEDFKKGVEYVHAKGGKLFMYISYHAVDEASKYFREEGGAATLVKDIWGNWVRYSETYAANGTYRKLLNKPRDQLCTCSGSDMWQEKMKKSANYCLELGADGVLYDLGGTRPLFCCAEGHDHKKPNEARASKANRYKELRANIKSYGDDRIIMEEHCIDIYSQHMDLVQPPTFDARGSYAVEMFRYTFPEVRMTNRNMALDEEKMLDNCNYSFMYGLAYDMSIFRCAGTFEDVPNYTAYMSKLVALRKQYSKYFFEGTFIDEDGFTVSGNAFRQKAYRAPDGQLGVAVWNASDKADTAQYKNTETGKTVTVSLQKDEVCFIEL